MTGHQDQYNGDCVSSLRGWPKLFEVDMAQQMDIKLTSFAASNNGRFFLLGKDQSNNDSHIILIDGRGRPLARAHTNNAPSVIIEGIMADESGVWLYGHAYQKKNVAKVWIERIEF